MKRNVSIVKNRIETIDFKKFCSGGSPEYVRAREKIKNLHIKKELPKESPKTIKAYSIYMNPLALIDPTFILIASSVLLVAFLERQLAHNGLVSIASVLSVVLKVAFPLVAAGSILYLISHSSFLFF